MRIRMIPCEQSGHPLLALGAPDPCVGTGVLRVPDSTAGAQSTPCGTATVRRRVTVCVKGARPDVGALSTRVWVPRVLKRGLGQLTTRVLGVRAPRIPEHLYLCEWIPCHGTHAHAHKKDPRARAHTQTLTHTECKLLFLVVQTVRNWVGCSCYARRRRAARPIASAAAARCASAKHPKRCHAMRCIVCQAPCKPTAF
jgi:hypothetical protein